MHPSIRNLCDFLDASPSVYHAAANVASMLEAAGYQKLSEGDAWTLEKGGKYYCTRGGSAVMAFRVPEGEAAGFLMTASHCDRPTFKVKENPELTGTYTRLAVERYGGMIMSSWLDRPLTVAGRALVETEQGAESRLVCIDKDLLMIPSVAIHMDRTVNDGKKWNPAVDLLPLMGGKEAAGKLEALLEEAAGGKLLGSDLYLAIRQKATLWGLDEEYISSAALDDLECVWGCTRGFLAAQTRRNIPVLCVFDSEEVGSNSVQGAASTILTDLLERICAGLGLELRRELSRSFMVSADNAHAIHPNHPEYADPKNAPVLGGGVVLKFNASQRYTTDGLSAAIFRKVCQKADVPVQTFFNRADLMGGSTLGHISLNHVSVPTADIGLPQLAMHSAYETAATADALHLEKAMTAFYSAELRMDGDSFSV